MYKRWLFIVCIGCSIIAAIAAEEEVDSGETVVETLEEKVTQAVRVTAKVKDCTFIPPEGWSSFTIEEVFEPGSTLYRHKIETATYADTSLWDLQSSVSLSAEPTRLTLQQYLHSSKEVQESLGHTEWRYLGKVQTGSGEAALCQVDVLTKWGQMKSWQAIIIRNGTAYTTSVMSPTDEFNQHIPDFTATIRSMTIVD